MDKFSKLQALLGGQEEQEVYQDTLEWDKYAHGKPAHLYEGTDSDDDEVITSAKSTNDKSNSQFELPLGMCDSMEHIHKNKLTEIYRCTLGSCAIN